MIDKIAFTVKAENVSVLQPELLTFQSSYNINNPEPDTLQLKNMKLNCDRFYYNTDFYNVESRTAVNQAGRFDSVIFRFNPQGVTFIENVKSVNSIISEIKNVFDFYNENTELSRIDLKQDIKLKFQCRFYIEALSKIESMGQRKNVTYKGETFYLRNKSREIIFYDKGLELTGQRSRLLRYETRLRKKKSLRKNLDVFIIDDIEHSESIFNQYLYEEKTELIEKLETVKQQSEVNFLDEEKKESILRFFNEYDKNGRYWVKNFLSDLGMKILKSGFTESEFMNMIYGQCSDTHYHRLLKLFNNSNSLTLRKKQYNLIDELIEKL